MIDATSSVGPAGRWARLALVGAVALSGCDVLDVAFRDPRTARGYRLAAAYDASALRTLEFLQPEDKRPEAYDYLWTIPARMQASCGDAKTPDGLGIFEAEAIGNRAMPALALLVERQGDVPLLDTDRVRVAIGDGGPEVFLEPAVLPRYLKVAIEGNVSPRYKQQLRTQINTYACMEHKTGRAWQGGDGEQVRQALLLNPPDGGRPDRKFFGGQSTPVAALLGPPEACLEGPADAAAMRESGKGETNLSLIPSDVWGAALPRCEPNLKARDLYTGPLAMKLTMSEVATAAAPPRGRRWSELRIKLRSEGEGPLEQRVQVEFLGDEFVGETVGDEGVGVLVGERPLFNQTESGQLGLIDIMSKVPYRYPTVGTAEEPEKYTVLLVPNWQLVEAIKRVHAQKARDTRRAEARADGQELPEETGPPLTKVPLGSSGEGIQDGVGWILNHPELLYVMVPSEPEAYDPHAEPADDGTVVTLQWNNLASAMQGGPGGVQAWGYATGMLAGRAPIALAGPAVPTWSQVVFAQRATHQAVFLGAAAALMLTFLAGFSRLRDLWTRVPEERVEFWPGPPAEEEGGDDAGELAAAGEGEEEA